MEILKFKKTVENQRNASFCYRIFSNKIEYLKIFKIATIQQNENKFRDQGPYSIYNLNKTNSNFSNN